MTILKSLQRLCDNSGMRQSLASPFSFDFDGQHYYGGTDGHALTVLLADGERLRGDGPPAANLLSRLRATHTVNLSALRDWLDGCAWEVVCSTCQGGKVHRCNCAYCEIERDEPCDGCEGEGVVKRREWVRFHGTNFDRALMARYFEPIRSRCEGMGEAVFTEDELAPFEIRGADWRVIVMPGRLTDDEERGSVPEGVLSPCR